jgi:LEA14-like dessication related protein
MRGFVRSLYLPLVLAMAACATPEPADTVDPPQMDIAGLTIGQSAAFQDRAWLDLRLTNPNAFALGIERLDFDLVINERYFASGLVDHTIALPAHGEVLVPIVMTIGTYNSSVTVQELGNQRPLPYSLIGEADLQQVPDQTLEFEFYGEMEPSKVAQTPEGLPKRSAPVRPLSYAG